MTWCRDHLVVGNVGIELVSIVRKMTEPILKEPVGSISLLLVVFLQKGIVTSNQGIYVAHSMMGILER